MLRRTDLFLLAYATLVFILNASLFLLSETRVDAYISINILVFYVTYAVIRPIRNPGLAWKILQVVLLFLFIIIVGYRIYEVIFK